MLESTVLFVDDQEEILFLIKRMLKDEPYKMLFASSGKEALEVINSNNIDVVVTDVLMANMSGLELLDVLKGTHPNIVRIILSGFSQIPTLLSAINNGKIFRYITKPWQVDEEAKKIIHDAIEYSHLLKASMNNIKEDVHISKICDFMKKKGDIYVVYTDNKVSYVHEKLMEKIQLDEKIDVGILSEIGEFQSFELTENIKIYIFE